MSAMVLRQSYVTQWHSCLRYSFILQFCFHLLWFSLTIDSLLCYGYQYFCLITEPYEKTIDLNNKSRHFPPESQQVTAMLRSKHSKLLKCSVCSGRVWTFLDVTALKNVQTMHSAKFDLLTIRIHRSTECFPLSIHGHLVDHICTPFLSK